jgi:predicted nuclease of predicted toxin-antitoxin system
MKFKIDENLPIEIPDILVRSGHEALTVHDQ